MPINCKKDDELYMAGKRNSVDIIKEHFPQVGEGFSALRGAAGKAGPLEPKILELILLSGYTVARMEGGYKTHAKRALDAGATPEEVLHATVINFGANAAIEQVADALSWADEVIAAR
jgi:4-carboxymuconolactone decarboxylase